MILRNYRWYRRFCGGIWYKHQFTKDAEELSFNHGMTWWARYGKMNRYSDVIEIENYESDNQNRKG